MPIIAKWVCFSFVVRAKKKYYVVWRGRRPGVYAAWSQCAAQVEGFSGASYKSFPTRDEAERAFEHGPGAVAAGESRKGTSAKPQASGVSALVVEVDPHDAAPHAALLARKDVVIYTDGGCDPNPGRGGYGVVLLHGEHRRELSTGYRLSTNNRMELMGWIAGLEALTEESRVVILSDSRYVGDSYANGAARRWQQNQWMRTRNDRAANADLWQRLLKLCDRHDVRFGWVRGHVGVEENECCDQLAAAATVAHDKLIDENYENDTMVPGGLFGQ